MPKRRLPSETWFKNIRPVIWKRDNRRCVRCEKELTLNECHIDHIKSGISSTNKFHNLRTLCRKCHVLRADFRHRGMTSAALRDSIIPANWRMYVWDDEELSKR